MELKKGKYDCKPVSQIQNVGYVDIPGCCFPFHAPGISSLLSAEPYASCSVGFPTCFGRLRSENIILRQVIGDSGIFVEAVHQKCVEIQSGSRTEPRETGSGQLSSRFRLTSVGRHLNALLRLSAMSFSYFLKARKMLTDS